MDSQQRRADPSDVIDAEWAPLKPPVLAVKPDGRPA
jgi:hypothetical protein